MLALHKGQALLLLIYTPIIFQWFVCYYDACVPGNKLTVSILKSNSVGTQVHSDQRKLVCVDISFHFNNSSSWKFSLYGKLLYHVLYIFIQYYQHLLYYNGTFQYQGWFLWLLINTFCNVFVPQLIIPCETFISTKEIFFWNNSTILNFKFHHLNFFFWSLCFFECSSCITLSSTSPF